MLCTSPWVSGRRLLERNQSCFSILPVTFLHIQAQLVLQLRKGGEWPSSKAGHCFWQMLATGISSLPLSYSDAVLFDLLSIKESYFNFTSHPPDLFWPQKHNIEMKSAKGIKGKKIKKKKRWKTNYGNISTAYSIPKNTICTFKNNLFQ